MNKWMNEWKHLFECQRGHYFYFSNWRRDRHFTWWSEPREGLAACGAKGIPSFLSYFKTLSIGPALGIEPTTSRSAVKPSTHWANPAAVKCLKHEWMNERTNELALFIHGSNFNIQNCFLISRVNSSMT